MAVAASLLRRTNRTAAEVQRRMAALSLGLAFAGSCNADVAQALMTVLMRVLCVRACVRVCGRSCGCGLGCLHAPGRRA